jgi:NTE family protein
MHFEGISGSSAGAMNAVVMASGWLRGGRAGARQALQAFWTAVGQQLPFELLTQGNGESISLTSSSRAFMHWASYFSPGQLNPFDLNPLRDLLNQQIDFEALRQHSPFKLFIAATQANTGKLRIFRETELSADVLLASACLPKLHHAVMIDGEPYWDGGYSANPAVFPLFYECSSRDVLLVLLTPLRHRGTPQRTDEIEQRGMEIAFSANFMREMRTFVQATDFAREGLLVGRLERRLCQMRFHMIDTHDLASLQRTETKLIAHRPFLTLLHDQGAERAGAWLEEHAAAVGRRATIDLKQWF